MDLWLKTREILEDALERPPLQRLRFVAEACAGDAQLRREVEDYLRFEDSAEQSLPVQQWIPEEPPASDQSDPERIGVYRILRRLGEGGMGVVYLAERDDAEYKQQVALKALKPGLHSAQLLRLFRRERQILAQLQHPNIAWLMDGGTVNGQVFYAMEYIEGSPVTTYCNERQLSVEQRLKLFCRICEAVSYAHRKLIIHRDLKPGNILVTADGTPKLLDFGLAKVFQQSIVPGTATVSIGPMLTPAYASPEQVRGEQLSTAADVYSLGVLLYELLTGRNPQAQGGQSPLEVCRTILEDEPQPPSHTATPPLHTQLRGDLDNILLRALRKEPELRYPSVDEFRQDIERYLGGFPVRASRGTAYYRLRKYLGRHRWGIAVSVLGALMTLGAAATVWWEGRQAQMRFDEVRALAHSVIFELHDAIRDLRGSTAARKLIVERGLEYLSKLEATGAKKHELQLEMAVAYRKIAEVQGGWARTGSNLGDTTGAKQSYEKARHLLKELLRSDAENTQVLDALAETDEGLGRVEQKLRNRDRYRTLWLEATEIRRKLAKRDPHPADAPARALWDVAEAFYFEHDWDAAVPAFRELLTAYQKLAAQEPGNPAYAQRVANCYRLLSYCERQHKEWDAALDHAREALRLDSAQAKVTPEDRNVQISVSTDWDNIAANLGHLDNWKDAVPANQQAVLVVHKLTDTDPADFDAAFHEAMWLGDLGEAYEHTGQIRKALDSYSQAMQIYNVKFHCDPENAHIRGLYAYFLTEFADLQARRKTRQGWLAAAAMYEQAEQLFAPLGPELALDDEDMATKADLPRRLAACKSYLQKPRSNRLH